MAWVAGLVSALGSFASSRGRSRSSQSGSRTESSRQENRGRQTERLFRPEDFAAIQALQQTLAGDRNEFTREKAMADSQALVAGLVRGLKEQGLPQIFAGQAQSGGYNSTTGQLLVNDVAARTAEAGARVQQQVINDYQMRKSENTQAVSALLELLRGAESVRTGEEISSADSRMTMTGSGVNSERSPIDFGQVLNALTRGNYSAGTQYDSGRR